MGSFAFFSFLSLGVFAGVSGEKLYSLRCVREGVVEVENKTSGVRTQVEKLPKVTVGTRLLGASRSYIDAEVFYGGVKAYRFTVDRRAIKTEELATVKKVHFECEGTRYDLDGSVHKFCGPWIEVFEKGPYGLEIFKGYEADGVFEPSQEIRFPVSFRTVRLLSPL